MTSDIFSGFPVLSTAQADQGYHHDGERGHGRCLPRLLREPQEPVYGGEFTYTSGPVNHTIARSAIGAVEPRPLLA